MKYVEVLKSLYGAIFSYSTVSKAFNVLWETYDADIKELNSYEALDDDVRELECIIKLYINNLVELAKVRGDIDLGTESNSWTFCVCNDDYEIEVKVPDDFALFFVDLANGAFYRADYDPEKKWFSLDA